MAIPQRNHEPRPTWRNASTRGVDCGTGQSFGGIPLVVLPRYYYCYHWYCLPLESATAEHLERSKTSRHVGVVAQVGLPAFWPHRRQPRPVEVMQFDKPDDRARRECPYMYPRVGSCSEGTCEDSMMPRQPTALGVVPVESLFTASASGQPDELRYLPSPVLLT